MEIETRKTSLSITASLVTEALRCSFLTEEADSGFDGGEFSGPAHEQARPRLVFEVLRENGWTPYEFERAVEEATTAKWAHQSELTGWAELICPSADCDPADLPHDAKALRECQHAADCDGMAGWSPRIGSGDREYDAYMYGSSRYDFTVLP